MDRGAEAPMMKMERAKRITYKKMMIPASKGILKGEITKPAWINKTSA